MNIIDDILQSTIQDNDLFHNKIKKNESIIIYGVGQGYFTFNLFVLQKLGLTADLLIDKKFTHDTVVNDITAVNLTSPVIDNIDKNISHVIITVGSKDLFKKMYDELLDYGFKNIHWAFEFYEYHLHYTHVDIIYGDISYYRNQTDSIRSAYNLLSDIQSKEIFENILTLYVSKQVNTIKHDPNTLQYLSPTVPLKKGFSNLINCGAYDGDTIKNIYKHIGKIQTLICIEPDLDTFAKLTNFIRTESNKFADQIIVFPFCLDNSNVYRSFTSDFGKNSNISKNIDVQLDSSQPALCVRLDDVLLNYECSLINMDIEGSEPVALLGAKNLISKHKPDLAVAAYHEVDHLWKIILLIHEICSDYKFYLRNHTGCPTQTVLYATTE